MNKNKKFFSYGLFKEGLRQTRMIGLVGLITVLAITLLIWFGNFADDFDYVMGGEQVTTTLYGMEVAAVLLLQYCVICPLMVLFLFRFLNKRDASDLYHALPYSRECVTVSCFSSVMAWNVITTLSTLVLVAGLYSFSPAMAINLSQLFSFGFNIFTAQFAVAASVLFAMSITGTAFSNVTVSLLVIFLPRLVLTALTGMMNTACVIVDIEKQFSFFNPALNVASGIPITAFQTMANGSGDSLLQCLIRPINGLYTLGLGLVLLVAAVWLLRKRKSETAGKSSPNRVLQAVYRVALGSVLGLLPVYVVFQGVMNEGSFYLSDIVILLVLLFFVALFYFLFELLTTKKAKNMVKAIPGFFVVLIIDAALLGATVGISNSLLNYIPQVSEIDEVYILHSDEENYFTVKTGEIALTDGPTRTLVSKALQETVDLVEAKRILGRGGSEFYGNYSIENYRTLEIAMECDRGKQYRYILVTHDQYDFFIKALEDCEEFTKGLYQMPTPETHTVISSLAVWDFPITKEQNAAVYQKILEDVEAMPFEQWYPIATRIHGFYSDRAFQVTVTVAENGKDYYMYFPITKTIFPKTFDLIMEYCNNGLPNSIEQFQTQLNEFVQTKKVHEDFDVSVTVLHPIEEYMMYDCTDEEWLLVLQSVVKQATPYTPGTDDVVVYMVLNEYANDYEYNQVCSTYFTVDREIVAPYLQESGKVYD